MRRRILTLVGATTSLVLIAFLVPLALLLRTVAADRAVQAATVEAQSLSSLVGTADRTSLALTVQQLDAPSPDAITVFLADGTVLGTPAERTPLVELGALGTSRSAVVDGGREIVVAVRDQAGEAGVIRSFVPDAELSRGVPGAWLLLGALGVGLLGLSLAVADRLARSLVRSTTDLAAVSHRLACGDLAARADPTAPGELGVVAEALNGLAGRIAELLREERETVADLAHRVRTPLTALRLDAEALPGQQDAARIGAGVDAVQRAVTQAIEQARRRGSGPGAGRIGSDAAAVVRERVAFWAVLAEDTDRETTVEITPGPLPVALGAADLGACVDALLGNIFAHTPDGTSFAVRLAPRPGGGAVFVVSDAGPGLPDGATVRRGASGGRSTGLGLDIARRSAEQAGGRLVLGRSARGGLEVVLELGGLQGPPA
ncbi:sensor histidine kinase [Pseudonocardia xinjiangensis]|uniref:histidine kinase n=1 Tax=Pseudonocardia xinjiangensis TaxID=75289 RepID=A0ABX1RBL1_9PSEU|nr:HAMP domain-containing sensor histidine kinase [Pseudonocardia xinjiangensis]NMH77407.1 HAMP domain-containing histidine kinase [Pseudonocardia xinjiangensis]